MRGQPVRAEGFDVDLAAIRGFDPSDGVGASGERRDRLLGRRVAGVELGRQPRRHWRRMRRGGGNQGRAGVDLDARRVKRWA